MNNEARLLRNKLVKVIKANAQRIREERQILGLYAKIEKQQCELTELTAKSQVTHFALGVSLPFTPNGSKPPIHE